MLTDRALSAEQLDGRWAALGRLPLPFETSHPGLFAVGDVRAGSTKRVAASVGEGPARLGADERDFELPLDALTRIAYNTVR